MRVESAGLTELPSPLNYAARRLGKIVPAKVNRTRRLPGEGEFPWSTKMNAVRKHALILTGWPEVNKLWPPTA